MLTKFLKILRLPHQTVTIIPFLLGVLDSGATDTARILVALFGLLSISLCIFIANEYFDSLDTDKHNPRKEKLSLASEKKLILGSFLFFLIAGIVCQLYAQTFLSLILGILVGISYSAPPLRLKARYPWDMISVLVAFAIVPYLAPFNLLETVPTQAFNFQLFFLLLFGFALQGIHYLGDLEADKKAGIKNFATVLGYRPFILLMDKFTLAATIVLGFLVYTRQSPWFYPYVIGIWFELMILGYIRAASSRGDTTQIQEMMGRTYEKGVKLGLIQLALLVGIVILKLFL